MKPADAYNISQKYLFQGTKVQLTPRVNSVEDKIDIVVGIGYTEIDDSQLDVINDIREKYGVKVTVLSDGVVFE